MTHALNADTTRRIEDYALIGNGLSAALVGRDGSIDWLCWPDFDSDACFAALLGSHRHGRWRLAPLDDDVTVTRRYRGDTMILETVFESPSGCVAVVDFMPMGSGDRAVVRVVEGRRGRSTMHMHLCLRFDYGQTAPWLTPRADGRGSEAVVGRHRVVLHGPVPLDDVGRSTEAEFVVREGERCRSRDSTGCRPPTRLGIGSARSCATSSGSGTSPTRGSGRSGAGGDTTRTPR